MWFYILLILIEVILCSEYRIVNSRANAMVKTPCNNKNRYGIGILILIFFSAIRYQIGYDFNAYLWVIDSYKFQSFSQVLTNRRYEILDNIIFYVGAFLNKPIISFAIYSVIIFGGLGIAVKKYSTGKEMSIIIYMSLFLIEALSSIRQTSADIILLLAFAFVRDRKLIKFLIMLLFAVGFHTTAIAGIGIYIVYQMPIIAFAVIFLTLLLFGRIILGNIVASFFPSYIDYVSNRAIYFATSGNLSKYLYLALLLYAIVIVAFIYKRSNNEKIKEIEGLIKIYATGVACPFLFGGLVGSRLGRYYLDYIVLLFPLCCEVFPKKQRYLLLIPFFCIYILYLYISTKNGTSYIPYITWFSPTVEF